MISLEKQMEIKRIFEENSNISIRAVSKQTGVSRNTVKRYRDNPLQEKANRNPRETRIGMQGFAPLVQAWVRKEELDELRNLNSMRDLYSKLVDEGYEGSYGSLTYFIRTIKGRSGYFDGGTIA